MEELVMASYSKITGLFKCQSLNPSMHTPLKTAAGLCDLITVGIFRLIFRTACFLSVTFEYKQCMYSHWQPTTSWSISLNLILYGL